MSLLGTLNTAKTALASNQVALQTVGNNIANAGNDDYNRQVVRLTPNRPQEIRSGLFVGTGVDVASIERQIDESVEQRLRASISDAETFDNYLNAADQYLYLAKHSGRNRVFSDYQVTRIAAS